MYELEFRFWVSWWVSELWQPCLASLDVLSLFKDLALDPHESSYFGQRSQRLIQLIVSIMIEYFVIHFETLVKFFGLMF